ncbi:MAG: cytochrome P450 [Oscillochloris sp.]|nr:cytochrome P450 [Oscillochloris sp.]
MQTDISPRSHPIDAVQAPLPPGPRGLPLLGSVLDFGRDPLGFLSTTARTYGDVARVAVTGGAFHLLAHPEQIEDVLVSRNRNFPKENIELLRNSTDYLLFGLGLLTSNGAFWLRQRRLAQPAFHRQRIAGYSRAMVAHTERMLNGWQDGQRIDAHSAMMDLTLHIVAETLFGASESVDAHEVGAALGVVMDVSAAELGQPIQIPVNIPTPSNLRFKRAVARLDNVIARLIAERRAASDTAERADLLAMLMAARDEDGSAMSDKQLRDEAVTLFLAGHETTALALSWTFLLLSRNPQARERLEQELDRVLAGRTPMLEDLPQLSYTGLVLKESMRIYPPAWILSPRVSAADTTIGGYRTPAGTQLVISPWVTQRDPRWFAEPERFIPERWEDGLEQRLPRFAYFPFGGGPRQCIGQSFALMEATLILATIAARYRLEPLPGRTITPQPAITLRPVEGLHVTLQKRPEAQPYSSIHQATAS